MLACVAEVFCHGASRVWGQKLQRRCIRCGSCYNGCELETVVLAEDLEELRNCGAFLTNGHINAVQMALHIWTCVDRLLVQDCINGDGSLARLPVTDDQFPLTAANGDQAVHGLQARSHRLMDALTRDDPWRLQFHSSALACLDGPKTING